MKNLNLLPLSAVLICLAACRQPPPPTEPVPQPKVEEPAAAAEAGAPPASEGQTVPATGAGNYLRGMSGHVKAAKEAVAQSNRQAEQRMEQDPAQVPEGY